MEHHKENVMGMELDAWKHKSCSAEFGMGNDWATLYSIRSRLPGKGHATELLAEAKRFYEEQGKRFGGTVALNSRMAKIYKRLAIKEYS
jgi:hypothetical protein